ncbi:hypothetical protein RCH14_003412 [Massilia sp. MP_M2]|uniref:hypothetical protein n=1 Tax=Massilia sp. MP_M2 TaxID=3071713 RepID=UPI00319E073D
MNVKHLLALVAAVTCSNVAFACEGPFPLIGAQLHVSERSPERVETNVTNPLERALRTIPRLLGIDSATREGSVGLALRFEGGATSTDLALVRDRIGEMRFADGVDVTSTNVVFLQGCGQWWLLAPPSPRKLPPQRE